MASLRPPATSIRLSCLLASAATATMAIGVVPAQAMADEHEPGGSSGWYDSSDPGSYHIRVRQPGRARIASKTNPNTPAASRNISPPYCEEAAAGLYVATPLTFISGKPVVCGAGASPNVTPGQLATEAWKALQLPKPEIHTAPPRGTAGLVGLPEWVWIPRSQWRPLSKRAAAGGVWAQVTARPERLSIEPGSGLAARSCAGPGMAYDPARPASGQHTDCSYTYGRPSVSRPGAVYRVKVTVVWSGAWTGSGGTGGALPDLSRSSTFSLRVGEAQGLYG